MFRFILGRLLQGLLVLLALYTITFFLAKAMPGEPFTTEKNVSETTKQYLRKLYGLENPSGSNTSSILPRLSPQVILVSPLVRAAPLTTSSRSLFRFRLCWGWVHSLLRLVLGCPLESFPL